MYEVTISGGGWGGDFLLDDTGDLVLSQDTADVPQATIERLTRMVLTTPMLRDAQGNPIGWADDIHHPDWGVGLRAFVNEAFNASTFQSIANAVISQLKLDPGVSQSSAPAVSFAQRGVYNAQMSISFVTALGKSAVLPTINLSPSTISIATSNGA